MVLGNKVLGILMILVHDHLTIQALERWQVVDNGVLIAWSIGQCVAVKLHLLNRPQTPKCLPVSRLSLVVISHRAGTGGRQ